MTIFFSNLMRNLQLLILTICLLPLFIKAQHAHINPNSTNCCHKGGQNKTIKNQTPLLHKYDVKFYFLDIAVERTSTDISGNVSIMSEVTALTLDTFAFELVNDLTVDSVLIDGVINNHTRIGDEVFVKLTNPLSQSTLFTAQIFYGGTPPSGGFFSGMSNATSSSWGHQITWSLSEPFNAKEWFPVKQVLGDKADSVYVYVTTDMTNKVGSNGLLRGIDTLQNNKIRYRWQSNYPIAYYLISIAVGEYIDYSFYAHPQNLNDSILIQNFIYNQAALSHFQSEIDMTKDFVELFSELYGLYPFWKEKYGHCMAPLSGGMEHQTMTTQGFFNFTLTSHELGHQWFGNNVTCATWSDIWINEGFASYSEYLALEHLNSGAEVPWLNSVHNNVKSQPGGSVYVPVSEAQNVWRIFDSRLSYKKGAAIVHMLRFELQNDSLFFHILRSFQSLYKDSVATGDDFKNVAENISGKNLTDFFDQWYYGEGFPTYNIIWTQFNNTLNISSTQTTSTQTTPLFKMLLPFHIQTAQGDTIIYLQQNQLTEQFSISFPEPILNLNLDSDKWLLMNVNNVIQGINAEMSIKDFAIYPNPTQNYLYIQFDNNTQKEIEIYSLNGHKIKSLYTNEFINTIDVSDLSQGMYFIKILDKDASYMMKKIVKK